MNATPNFCPHCGAPVTANNRFCEHCGQPVAPAQSPPAPKQPASLSPTQAHAVPPAMTPVQATQPPRTNRTGCVLGVVLAVIVLCCVVLLIAGVMLFNLGDFDGESWLGFELTPTAVARTPPPRSPSDSGGLALEEALGGSGGPTPTGQPAPALPATADDFVGVWEVIAAQDADGSPRDDLVGGQIRLLLADDGETILGVQPPDKEPTEADLSLQVSEGRTAVGEIINSDPKVVVTVVLSEDGQELELTMSTSSQEVLLVLKRIEDGAGQ